LINGFLVGTEPANTLLTLLLPVQDISWIYLPHRPHAFPAL